VGVIAYNPDLNVLASLLTVISQGGNKIWLFLNSPMSPDEKARLSAAAPSGLQFLNDGENLGLGVAYNRIAETARAAGAQLLMILDQDSSPPLGMVAQLRNTYELLRARGERPAVIGPLAVSADHEQFKPPRIFRHRTVRQWGSAWPATFVISSGSLLDLDALPEVGAFREDFFIDAIDIEWCFRAWSRGYTCWIDNSVLMPHRLGQGTIRIPFLGMHLARQPPSRLYTYVRNQTAMLRLSHIRLSWRLRIVPYLVFQGMVYFAACRGARWRTAYAFTSGLADGLWLRLGDARRQSVNPTQSSVARTVGGGLPLYQTRAGARQPRRGRHHGMARYLGHCCSGRALQSGLNEGNAGGGQDAATANATSWPGLIGATYSNRTAQRHRL
jgi:rhamnosyltransferase